MRSFLLALALSLAALAAVPLDAQELASDTTEAYTAAPTALAVRTDTPPIIEGLLGDAVWQSAPIIADFLQHEPFEGQPATERTEVRILFDQQALQRTKGRWAPVDRALVVKDTKQFSCGE